jgi:hypothetical protein
MTLFDSSFMYDKLSWLPGQPTFGVLFTLEVKYYQSCAIISAQLKFIGKFADGHILFTQQE